MTIDEFNEIRNRTHVQSLKHLRESISKIQEQENLDMAVLLATLSTESLFAAENAVYEALIEAGFITFDG